MGCCQSTSGTEILWRQTTTSTSHKPAPKSVLRVAKSIWACSAPADAVLTSRAMPPIFKSRIGHGGLSTELQDGTAELYETSVESPVESDVQEPTSMIGAVGGGAAAAGGLAFLLCQTHCPGGVTGAIGGMMGAMNPLSLFMKKDEKDAEDEENAADGMEKLQKQISTIEKQLCSMNCKLTSMVGAAAGAAAGHAYNKYQSRRGGGGMGGGMGGMGGKGMGGGMSMGGGAMGGFQMLDDWTAPSFFVFMKQLADMQRDVNQANSTVRKLCYLPENEDSAKPKERRAALDFF
eukprot:symbB.v1.2.028702.t1/scaffold3068.1/size68108/8